MKRIFKHCRTRTYLILSHHLEADKVFPFIKDQKIARRVDEEIAIFDEN
jgi:hypothetical protein